MNWYKISEKIPPFNKRILLSDGKLIATGVYADPLGVAQIEFLESGEFLSLRIYEVDKNITHWAELPSLPN